MTSAAARPQLLRTEPSEDVVQIEFYSHGPQWQRRARFEIGTPGRRVGHGQAFCSVEMAELLTRVFLASGLRCRVIDRSGPEPVFYRSADTQLRADEHETARTE